MSASKTPLMIMHSCIGNIPSSETNFGSVRLARRPKFNVVKTNQLPAAIKEVEKCRKNMS